MSKVKGINELESGSNVVVTLTGGKKVSGVVHRLAKRGGVLAAVYVTEPGSDKDTRVGVPKVESVTTKGKSVKTENKKKQVKEKKVSGKKERTAKKRVGKKAAAEKPAKKSVKKSAGGSDKGAIKEARDALKAAHGNANAALTALKVASNAFVKAQGKNSPERKDMLAHVKSCHHSAKESMASLKAAELKIDIE